MRRLLLIATLASILAGCSGDSSSPTGPTRRTKVLYEEPAR